MYSNIVKLQHLVEMKLIHVVISLLESNTN